MTRWKTNTGFQHRSERKADALKTSVFPQRVKRWKRSCHAFFKRKNTEFYNSARFGFQAINRGRKYGKGCQMLNNSLIKKLKRYTMNRAIYTRTICPYCGESVTMRHEAYTNVDYVKRKNGTEQFFHSDCFRNYLRRIECLTEK